MSRIHEALQKARDEWQPGEPLRLPTIEEMLQADLTALPPEAAPSSGAADQRELLLAGCNREPRSLDKKRMLFSTADSDPHGREQFRTLRSRLYQFRNIRPLSVIAISSAVAAEGKSFTSANLAHVLALQHDRRVLLIDCDLHRGTLAEMLGAPGSPGLSDYLLGEQPLMSVVQFGAQDNIFFIPSGRRVSQPGELVADPRLGRLLAEMRTLFDWIVIDTAPALQFSEASMIADLSDGVLLVVGAGSTPVHLVKRACQEFKKQALLGVVLNRAEEITADYKYYYSEAPQAPEGATVQ